MAKKTEKVKRKLRKEQFVRVTSALSLKELERLAAEGTPTTERPQVLPLKDIHVAPRVFQWRRPSLLEDEQIMSELVQALNGAGETSSTLDPLVVTAIGKRFFVIDGHHRLDAYHTVKWKRLVPVRYYEGNIKQARTASLKMNSKNKLRMSQEEKGEAAWSMMLEGIYDPERRWTWKQIMETAQVAKTTLRRMSFTLKALLKTEERTDEAKKQARAAVMNMTWAEARKQFRQELHEDMSDAEKHDWKEEKARELAEYLAKGPNLIQDPEITARALTLVSGLLPKVLVDEWADEAVERVRMAVKETVPGKLPALEEVLEALQSPYRAEHSQMGLEEADLPDTANPLDFLRGL